MCVRIIILKVCLLGDDHVIVDEEEPPFPPELTHEVNALYNYEHLTCKLIKIQLSHSWLIVFGDSLPIQVVVCGGDDYC